MMFTIRSLKALKSHLMTISHAFMSKCRLFMIGTKLDYYYPKIIL